MGRKCDELNTIRTGSQYVLVKVRLTYHLPHEGKHQTSSGQTGERLPGGVGRWRIAVSNFFLKQYYHFYKQ